MILFLCPDWLAGSGAANRRSHSAPRTEASVEAAAAEGNGTHLTPKRSMNMTWFRKVLLMSRSICLTSVEDSRARSFIF